MAKKEIKRGQVETTSEDEKNKGGTLDSAPIDRAKSFEYFPGESFPLQENSSSYEYLPGKLRILFTLLCNRKYCIFREFS